VRNEEVVTTRVKELLSLRGFRAEVVNMAVSSYNLSQEVASLRHEGIRYQPDWVVVDMCWNDINDKTGVKVSADGWLISQGASEKTGLQRYFDSELVYELRNIMKKSRLASLLRSLRARANSRPPCFQTSIPDSGPVF
jgi:hypothetical protein